MYSLNVSVGAEERQDVDALSVKGQRREKGRAAETKEN